MLAGVNDPTSGILTSFSSGLATELTSLGKKISTDQTQISNLQTQLTDQAEAADSSIASMEQQLSYYTSLFSAEQTNEQSMSGG